MYVKTFICLEYFYKNIDKIVMYGLPSAHYFYT
jgi:hypothetical protein